VPPRQARCRSRNRLGELCDGLPRLPLSLALMPVASPPVSRHPRSNCSATLCVPGPGQGR
jgi:hypothetical protein